MVFGFDLTALVQPLLRTDIPPLPETGFRQVCVHLLWGLLLAALAWRAGTWLQLRWRLALSAIAVLWAAVPGPISPAYWLEMAFSAPSWTSALLCGQWLLQQKHSPPAFGAWGAREPAHIPRLWAFAGVAVGWVLALDTFAALPIGDSIYAWGFSPLATVFLMLVGAGAWLVQPRPTNALVWLAVALYVATRLPSGNAWDAVIDPLLWLYLHGAVAAGLWRQLRAKSQR